MSLASLWGAPLLAHLLVLVVVLVGVAAATSGGASFTPDEGSYELQLRALDAGSWAAPTGTEAFDPDGEHQPIVYAQQTDDGWVPLAKHPLWPWLALQISAVTGVAHAYAALGVVAVALAAAIAWRLAAEADPGGSRTAFWLTGTAPVVVTFALSWAHAASAMAGGLALLGAVRLVGRGASAPTVAALGTGLALGVGLRTEGVLMGFALALGVAIGGWDAGRARWRTLLWGGGIGASTLGLVLLEERWVRAITGSGTATFDARSNPDTVGRGFLDERFMGAVRSLLDGSDAVPRLVVAVALLVVIGASVAAASGRRRAVGPWQVGATVLLVLLVLRVVAEPTFAVTGMLFAWPIVVIGVAAALPSLRRSMPVETVVAVSFIGAVLATQYADGGGDQWGGRFYAPATVALAAIATVGLRRLLRGFEGSDRARAASATLIVVALVPLIAGVAVVHSARAASERLFDDVAAASEGIVITTYRQLPRSMWSYDVRWLVVDGDDGGEELGGLLDSLGRDGGPEHISLIVRDQERPAASGVVAESPTWSIRDTVDAAAGFEVVVLERTDPGS